MRRTRRLGGLRRSWLHCCLTLPEEGYEKCGASSFWRCTVKTCVAMDTSYSKGNAQDTVGVKITLGLVESLSMLTER